MTEDMGQLSGTCVSVMQIIGMPYSRFRVAVPEELLPGSLAEITGRRDGMSANAIERTSTLHAEHLATMFGVTRKGLGKALSSESLTDLEKAARQRGREREDAAAAERALITGTALCFAYLYHARLEDPVAIARRQYQTSLYFAEQLGIAAAAAAGGEGAAAEVEAEGADSPLEVQLDELVSKMLVLLRTDNMRADRFWLDRGRLWRLIFLQRPAGFWCGGRSCLSPMLAHASW